MPSTSQAKDADQEPTHGDKNWADREARKAAIVYSWSMVLQMIHKPNICG
jgi:hypothetical protein